MNSNGLAWDKVKQLSVIQMLLATLIPSAIAFSGFHFIAPKLVEAGMSKIYSWAIIAIVMLLVLVILAIIFLQKEAKQLGVTIFERMCFKKVPGKLWIISIGIMLGSLITVSGAQLIIPPILTAINFTIPSYTPFFLNPTIDPLTVDLSVIDPNIIFKGNYLLVFIMAIALFLNILAEELYFRAWMLPKTSSFGKWAWVINGALFALYHTFQFWLFPAIIVSSLAMAFVFYKTRSIWPSMIGHFIGNFVIGIMSILFLVMGLA